MWPFKSKVRRALESYLTYDGFHDWLTTTNRTDVGMTCDNLCCPISQYLMDVIPNAIGASTTIDSVRVYTRRGNWALAMPSQLRTFIARLDTSFDTGSRNTVPREHALTILEGVSTRQ